MTSHNIQRIHIGKVDSFDGNPVLALRYEELPSKPKMTKQSFVAATVKGGGFRNKRSFAGVAKKATLISLEGLPQGLLTSVEEGIYMC